jgi:hypothetical protein
MLPSQKAGNPNFRASARLSLHQAASRLNWAMSSCVHLTLTRRSGDGACCAGGDRSHRSATVRKVRSIRLTVSASNPAVRTIGNDLATSCSTRLKPPITAALPRRDRKPSSWEFVERGISRRQVIQSGQRGYWRMIADFALTGHDELVSAYRDNRTPSGLQDPQSRVRTRHERRQKRTLSFNFRCVCAHSRL